jgi:uncharacterized tellurite resistance protein B-like protein
MPGRCTCVNDAPMSLKDWFERQTAPTHSDPAIVSGVNLAVAALLVEVLRADYDVTEGERQQVVDSVTRLLGLDPEASAAIVAEAERHLDQAHDLYQFTSRVNRTYSDAEKLELLEALWRVAHSDQAVHKYEEHLIRRVADLLHIPHAGYITAKLRATGDPGGR